MILYIETIKGAKNKKFKNYSLGMKQRLGIALSLINEPEVMILDEPFNGIDPEGIYELSNLISELNKNRNITIIISSHVLDDLYRLCSRFIILNDGHIIKNLSKEELDLSLDSKFIITLNLDERYKTKFIKKFGENNILFDKSSVMIISNVITYNDLINWMRAENIDFSNVKEEKKTLNELFIEIIGGK